MQLEKDRPQALRVLGEMTGADEIMHQAIFLGTYPGLTKELLAHDFAVIRDFVKAKSV
jgi:CDP-6-deoxy-D-xylo-4-hexulose-3-dehydrase